MSDLDVSRIYPQAVELHLSIYKPNTILACRVNDAAITKGARTITYDSVTSGSYVNIVSGMTLWVGSSLGAKDKGKVRVRSATSSTLVVAENSHISWANDLYLTVVDFLDVVPIFPRIVQDPNNPEVLYWYKDYDVAYTNQNQRLGAFVCMGPHRAATLNDDGEAKFWYSASGTVHANGDSLTYAWSFPGADGVTGSTSFEPGYITYKTPGHYLIKLTVTGNNGSIDNSYRYVSIYPQNQREPDWEITEGQGSRGASGYLATVILREAWDYEIYDGATVVIYSDSWYGVTKQSVGGNAKNNGNILFVGYIVQGSIKWSYDRSSVEFQIASVDEVMKSNTGFAISIENSPAAPTTWYQIQANNLKKSIYHFLRWHSTVLLTTDFHFVATDNYIQYYDTDRESLFDAVNSVLKSALFGELVSDLQGGLWAETSMEATHNAKTTYLPICTITKSDWINEPTIQELFYDTVSYLEMGGIQFNPFVTDNNSYAYLAGAPGVTPGYQGRVESPTGLAVSSQAHLNQIVGDVLAYRNAKKPTISFELAGSYRIFDIAPQRAVQVVIAAEDTSRNVAINAPYFISGLRFSYSSKNMYLRASITLREITEGVSGDTITIPINPPIPIPPIPIPPFPPLPPYDPPAPPYVPLGLLALYVNGIGLWFTNELGLDSPHWYAATTQDEWTLEERQSIVRFDMNRYGVAFLSSSVNFWSQLVGKGNSKTLICDQDYLTSQIGLGPFSGNKPVITAIGADYIDDDSCALYACMGYPDSRGQFFLASISGISPRLANPGIYEREGNFTAYNGSWYFSHAFGIGQEGRLYRLDGELNTINSGLVTATLYHTHAVDADFIYTSAHEINPAKRVIDSGETIAGTYPATVLSPQAAACDPTGQYVMTYDSAAQEFLKSTDYGATFTTMTLPHTPIYTTPRFLNLGDENTWIVVYNQSPSVTLEVMYTPDFGVTWISKIGDLLDWVPDTAGVIAVKFA